MRHSIAQPRCSISSCVNGKCSPAATEICCLIKSIPVTIELGKDGKILLNGKRVNLKTLESRLKALGSGSKKKTAIVRADRRLDYGRVVRVLGICRASGFYDIGIAVK